MSEAARTRRARVRARLRAMSQRELFFIILPAVLLVIAAFWFTAQFIQPAPPRHVVVSTGAPGGAYEMFAARYADVFRRNGIELEARLSAGALENLQRLKDPEQDVDAGFLQGGLARGDSDPNLVSLGSFYLEPLWVFHRGGAGIDRLTQLAGKRVAIGGEGSGTRALALELLEANGVTAENTRLLPLGGLDAVAALASGKADAIFLVGVVQSPAVWTALYTEGLHLISFTQADAYARRFPYLSKIVLPRGAIDLVRDIPAQDVQLIAPTASIVVREDTHPALIDLFMQAAAEVHGEPDIFQDAGEFPNEKQVDYPLSTEADRFYKSGVSFLQRYLPFWAATLIDRLIVLLIPLIAVLFPLFKILPLLYSWRVRARVYRWYGELKFLEHEIEDAPPAQREEWLSQLDRLEERVNQIATPLAFANELYILREHIGLVRNRLKETAPAGPAPAA
jgi:TRAP transporter TAXI family solute receptor